MQTFESNNLMYPPNPAAFAPADVGVHMLYGMKVIVSPNVPKKPRFLLSDAMVAKFEELGHTEHVPRLNAMLIELFGEDEQALFVSGTLYVLPETWHKVKDAYMKDDIKTIYRMLGIK